MGRGGALGFLRCGCEGVLFEGVSREVEGREYLGMGWLLYV